MPVDVKIIVTDAPPLIALAAPKASTTCFIRLCRSDAVRVEPTEAFATAQLAARAGRRARLA
jgi:hypothetical protein